MSKVKLEIEALHLFQLKDINLEDFDFWVELRQHFLLPDSPFTQEMDLRGMSAIETIRYLRFA